MTPNAMSRIRTVDVRAIRVPMAHPHQTAGGTVSESPLVLTDITTEDDLVGRSVVFTYTAPALKPTADLRDAVGPGVAIMVDYNQCLTPVEAVQRLRVLDEEGLTWVEEPTLAHDYAGHAFIAREARTPIQCGENWWGTLDMQHAIDVQASDFMMLDVMKIGGVTGWLRAAALAHVKGIRISTHLWPEISAQLLCLTPTAHWLEYADWWNPIMSEPLTITRGMADVGGATGTGVAWNEAAVERCSA
jgi:mandelate racemase